MVQFVWTFLWTDRFIGVSNSFDELFFHFLFRYFCFAEMLITCSWYVWFAFCIVSIFLPVLSELSCSRVGGRSTNVIKFAIHWNTTADRNTTSWNGFVVYSADLVCRYKRQSILMLLGAWMLSLPGCLHKWFDFQYSGSWIEWRWVGGHDHHPLGTLRTYNIQTPAPPRRDKILSSKAPRGYVQYLLTRSLQLLNEL
jgi:hypothetical protein